MRIYECNKCGEVWAVTDNAPREHECEEEEE